MNRRDYQKEMEAVIEGIDPLCDAPVLVMHSCCAPCSSACIERLSGHFRITVFYFNPNIYPEDEYRFRALEQQRFLREFPAVHPISFIEGDYSPDRFYDEVAKGLEDEPERGARCVKCYRMRLSETALTAKDLGADYFATTLTLSPLKDAAIINSVGEELAREYGVSYLVSDFKKKNGYLRSTQLSAEYGMYRQDYCGCEYSMRSRDDVCLKGAS